MSVCKHGINLKHRRCSACEEIAEAEQADTSSVKKVKSQEIDTGDIFELDGARLDELLNSQPKLFRQYADMLADAEEDYERAKAALALAEADTDREIRVNPSAFGIEKLTEDALKRRIIVSQRYRAAQEKLIQARHYADKVKAVVQALHHRKAAIEGRLQLFTMDYYAEPKMPRTPEAAEMEIRQTFKPKRRNT